MPRLHSVLIVIALALPWGALAQPLLQANVLPAAGTVIRQQFADSNFVNFSPGPAGANQIWDFARVKADSAFTRLRFRAASGTPNAAQFPNANLVAETILGTSDTVISSAFFGLSSGELVFWGNTSAGVLNQFSNPETILRTPLSFGTTFTDESISTNQSPPFASRSRNSKRITYDGYGVLLHPYGTFNNCIRINNQFTRRDTFLLAGGSFIADVNGEQYDWYLPGRPLAIFTYYRAFLTNTINIPGIPPSVTRDTILTGIFQDLRPTSTTQLRRPELGARWIGANQARTDLQLELPPSPGNTAPLLMRIVDVQGRIHQQEVRPGGEPTLQLPVARLTPGWYFLILEKGPARQVLPWYRLP